MSARTAPPSQVAAGDSIEFELLVDADYAAWTGVARLGDADGTVSLSGTTATVVFASDDTETLATGHYTLAVAMETIGRRQTIATYAIEITPNVIDATTGEDTRSHARKMLALVEAALEGRIPAGYESYSIDGTAVAKIPVEHLRVLRRQYAAEVARESANGMIGSVQFAVAAPSAPWRAR